jgi:hypothetical protein
MLKTFVRSLFGVSDEDMLKEWQECYDFVYDGDGNDWRLKKGKNDEKYVSYFKVKWEDEKVTEKEVNDSRFAAMTLRNLPFQRMTGKMYEDRRIEILKKAFKVFQRKKLCRK